MSGSIGPLLPSDELFIHQIVDTFGAVSQSDYSWAEKVCAMAAARDGSLQLAFGFGKYTNRNVVDAYAGVSCGVEQWTVRASRAMASDPESVSVGPIHYEIVEPLKSIRVRLDVNNVQPIAFDILFKGIVPAWLEEREDRRGLHGVRRDADQIRYHQTGTAEGWAEVEGRRTEISPRSWVSTRDHSWGIRPMVGVPLTDLEPADMYGNVFAVWNPVFFERQDGSRYALLHYHLEYSGPGFRHLRFQGNFENPDGSRQMIASLKPEIRFNARNKRFLGGRFIFTMADGSLRPLDVKPIGDTGFHLGTGLYNGGLGQYHGSWRGSLHLSGEYFENCADPATVERINQFRDCMIKVSDPVGGAEGWGNCQTYVSGIWPEFGLP
ncbi:MAG: hypothetical protein FJ012_05080 [Chloroflexi bacterium]|nr:hypothetical protein [Chloroflexota bacterium]